ncbi:MAG: hypothetical protein AAFY78_05845 [Cyanobacteria bacterium J06648_16]
MSRTLLYTLPGAVCLAALLSIAFTAPEDALLRESTRLLDTAVQAQVTPDALAEMSIERLDQILQSEANDLQGGNGQWQMTVEGQTVIVLADATNNRMRIVAPVVPTSSLSSEQIQAMLVANFHSALDARYAVSNGNVVSIFVHPLSTLQETDLRSGLRQVAVLADTFGSSYSSGGLGFLPNGQRPTAPVPDGSVGI